MATKVSFYFETLDEAETKAATLRNQGLGVEITRLEDFRYVVVARDSSDDKDDDKDDESEDFDHEDSEGFESEAGDDEPH